MSGHTETKQVIGGAGVISASERVGGCLGNWIFTILQLPLALVPREAAASIHVIVLTVHCRFIDAIVIAVTIVVWSVEEIHFNVMPHGAHIQTRGITLTKQIELKYSVIN